MYDYTTADAWTAGVLKLCMESDTVATLDPQALAHGLVREYLTRHGFKAALFALDESRPPAQADITSRSDIVRALKLEAALRCNRERVTPRRSLLEVLAGTMITADTGDSQAASIAAQQPSACGQPPAQSVVTVSLPSGGPLDDLAAKAAKAAKAAAEAALIATTTDAVVGAPGTATRPRRERPKSARGARTPNIVSGPALVPGAPRAVRLSDQKSTRLVVHPGDCCGGVVELSDLTGCEILVLDWSKQVTMDDCCDCRVLIGPVDGSLMLRDCTGIRVSAVCRQLRCRGCADCDLRLFTFGPVIESSVRMRFGPWDASYAALAEQLACAKIDLAERNLWAQVHDFNEPTLEPGAQPANWSEIPEIALGATWEVESAVESAVTAVAKGNLGDHNLGAVKSAVTAVASGGVTGNELGATPSLPLPLPSAPSLPTAT